MADHSRRYGAPNANVAMPALFAAGQIAPQVQTLPLGDAAEAHRRLKARQVLGKLVLAS